MSVQDIDTSLGSVVDVTRTELGQSTGDVASRPLFGKLPLRRVVPQDLHSVMDYAGGLSTMVAGVIADSPTAKAASFALASTVAVASALTDYRLSVAKVIPIEVHEVLDYVYGASVIAAPFALGYHRKEKLATAIHLFVGVSTIIASLFTDYRARRGVRWGR